MVKNGCYGNENFSLAQDCIEVFHVALFITALLAWHSKFKKHKALKKKISEKLISIKWHPGRWSNFSISQDEKKKQNQFLLSDDFNVYNMEVLNILLQRLDIIQKSSWISSYFDTENYIWTLNIVFVSDCFF